MTFKCCQNCIIDMICTDPCEKFEIEKLHLDNLSNFNKCLRLIKKYMNKKFINGNISIEIESNLIAIYKNDELHRDNGPAVVYKDGTEEWYKDGKRHRDDGPAVIDTDGYQVWYKNGKRHRDDGPAVIVSDGSKVWYKNGKRHRDNGPAIIRSDGYKAWYKNGVRIKNDIQMLSKLHNRYDLY